MVKDADVEQCQRLFQANRDRPVGCTSLRVTTGVVVEEHQSRGVVMQGALDASLARLDRPLPLAVATPEPVAHEVGMGGR